VIKSANDINLLMDTPSVIEDMVSLSNELAVIAVRNDSGEIRCFDAVSMDFHPDANLLDLLLYPAPISLDMQQQAVQIAERLIEKLNICGLLAVEFLVDQQEQLWINEVAPRPHNSGHQTIESAQSSQYEQHLRGILNLPLGSTQLISPSAMANLLGEESFQGPVHYEGLTDCLSKEGVYVHLYGKKTTKPFRKMGHVTVTHSSLDEAKKIAQWVKQTIKVKSLS
jgi:5-(carboxyamino)imidazole ribonucleotide synthase